MRGNLDTVTTIPLKTCSGDDPSDADLCPQFPSTEEETTEEETTEEVTTEENYGESQKDIGNLRGEAGKANSAYLVFGIRMVEGANINYNNLKQIRIVAFASSGIVNDFEWATDNPITTVQKRIATARISSAVELNYLATISRNTVTLKSDDLFLNSIETTYADISNASPIDSYFEWNE